MKKTIGIYNPYLETMGGGEKVCLALAEVLSEDNKVSLVTHNPIDKKKLESYFGLDLSKVKITVVKPDAFFASIGNLRFLPGAITNIFRNLAIFRQIKKLDLDVFVNNCYHSDLPSPAKNGVYMCMFPHKLPSQHEMNTIKKQYAKIIKYINKLVFYPKYSQWLDTYQVITANSQYTQGYIKKYWDRDSEILYPICDSMLDKKIAKKKIILNVGRFFENNGANHHKRQDVLLETFKGMTDLHKNGWELHFAGSVANDIPGLQYAVDMVSSADGFPVYFHFNAPLARLKHLYNEATIYWHATGFESDADKYPERQEHFGISTVEAMSTGAIPVVINTAGQKEVVAENVDGYLWSTLSELSEKTISALSSNNIAKVAVLSSTKYNREAFRDSAFTIFDRLFNSTNA